MRPRTAALGAVLTALALPGAAAAFYGNGATIVSADLVRLEQGDDLTLFADIGSGGRYVAFQTRARNFFADDDPDPPERFRQGGVFRRDLQAVTPLALVAGGDERDEETQELLVRGAANPSVSADGRYVAFSTGEALVAQDVNGHVDVYVRDMTVARSAPGAYELASARDGTADPAAYEPRPQPAPGLDPGAELTRGVAISDDGRKVLFRTLAASDLPAAAGTTTPAGQLFVRDLDANTTALITRAIATGEPAGGALGGALSSDGSTVVWTGRNAAAQTPFLPGESAADVPYYLWRRVADGAAAPTRRITGAVDLDDPACAPGTAVAELPTATGPCYGPLTSTEYSLSADISSLVPAISADGRRVAFVTGSGPRPNAQTPDGFDLWITSMAPGVSRKQGSTELTREATATDSGIDGLALSADGRYLAFATLRNTFPLSALRLVGSARSTTTARELYLVDLQQRSFERVLRGSGGGEIAFGVEGAFSLAAQASRIAFVSSTADLFFGDANERADAFVVTRQAEPPNELPPPPPDGGVTDAEIRDPDNSGDGPALPVRTRARRGGVLELTVTVPAAGGVKAVAKVRVGQRRALRTLSTATSRARRAGTTRLVLRPVRRYRGELRRRGSLRARVTVSFVASRGGRRLARTIRATVKQKVPRRRAKR